MSNLRRNLGNTVRGGKSGFSRSERTKTGKIKKAIIPVSCWDDDDPWLDETVLVEDD